MGNYVFRTDTLIEAVSLDAKDEDSKHDLGGNIIPMMVERGEAEVYDFADNDVPGATDRDRGYWRDVGTLDAYYDAHMDLISVHPVFNLYNRRWPILTWHEPLPPAKFVFEDGEGRTGHALDSMVSAGVVVSGGTVRRSILSPGVRVHSGALVEGSVLMHDVDIGRGAVVRNAILDKNVQVPEGAQDRRRPGPGPGAVRGLRRRRGRHREGPEDRRLTAASRAAGPPAAATRRASSSQRPGWSPSSSRVVLGEGGRGGGGQGGGQRLAAQGVDGAGHGPVRAEPQAARLISSSTRSAWRRRSGATAVAWSKSTSQGRPSGVDDHAVAAQVAVGDAGLVEAGHLLARRPARVASPTSAGSASSSDRPGIIRCTSSPDPLPYGPASTTRGVLTPAAPASRPR